MEGQEDPRLTNLLHCAKCYRTFGRALTKDCFDLKDMENRSARIIDLDRGADRRIPHVLGVHTRIIIVVLRSIESEFSVLRPDFETWVNSSLNLDRVGTTKFDRLETPLEQYGPYIYLTLKKCRDKDRVYLGGFLVHDMDDCEFDKFWMANADLPSPSSDDDYRGFNCNLQGWLAEHYLQSVQAQARPIELEIQNISDIIQDGATQTLGSLLNRLNNCSRDVRMRHLVQNTTFGLTAAHQAGEGLRSLHKTISRRTRANELLALSSEVPSSRPVRLRARIAELRAIIADIADQQRQEREDKRQQREEKRQERKEELCIIRDKQEAQYREREERLQQLRDEIMAETRRDSRTMRGVAWMTMAFLPATFVTSFFGMNFFNPAPGKPVFDKSSRDLWVFFAVALPISAIILTAFYWWDRKVETDREAKRP